MIEFVVGISKLFSNIQILRFQIITPSLFVVFLIYILLFLIIKYKKFNFNVFRISLLVSAIYILISSLVNKIPNNYIDMSMIDVGQGDSFFIETPNHKTIIIDGGGSEHNDYDVGSDVLLPYLLDRGVNKIDAVFISHSHDDHIEGIFTIIERLKVKKIFVGKLIENDKNMKKLRSLCKINNVELIQVFMGDTVFIDNVKFEILFPHKNQTCENLNNMSLVIKMSYIDKRMLFTGDIEVEIENVLNKNLRAEILKVSHHGSSTSSSENFVKKVSPIISLISVADKNKYGHPSNEIIERLEQHSNVYVTKDSGEIKIRIYKNGKIYIKERIKTR